MASSDEGFAAPTQQPPTPETPATPPMTIQGGAAIAAASRKRAKAAFENFTLSKFANGAAAPINVVQPGQDMSSVQDQTHVNHLKTLDASGRRLRVTLSDSDLKTFLPSFKRGGKTMIKLDDLMTLIQTNMHGSEFYCVGHPTLVNLKVQAKADQLITAVTEGDGSNK